jgi:hypothetical protein
MELQKFLTDNHHAICAQWAEAIIKTYPEEGAKFFSGSTNQFANPVGHTFRSNVDRIYKVLVSGVDVAECAPTWTAFCGFGPFRDLLHQLRFVFSLLSRK